VQKEMDVSWEDARSVAGDRKEFLKAFVSQDVSAGNGPKWLDGVTIRT